MLYIREKNHTQFLGAQKNSVLIWKEAHSINNQKNKNIKKTFIVEKKTILEKTYIYI